MPEVQGTGEGKLQKTWDPWKMFDVSQEELQLMKQRKEMAAARKAEFRMIKSNPAFVVNGGLGGHIVDPQMKRWEASRATYGDYFKITRRNTKYLFLVYILPVAAGYFFISKRMTLILYSICKETKYDASRVRKHVMSSVGEVRYQAGSRQRDHS